MMTSGASRSLVAVGAEQANFLVTAFAGSLEKIQTTNEKLLESAFKAEQEIQKYMDQASQSMLKKVEDATDPAIADRFITVYDKLMAANKSNKMGAVQELSNIAQNTLTNELSDVRKLVEDAIKVRMELIVQEDKKLDIQIKDAKAAAELDMQKKKFDNDLKVAAENNKAAILQKQYDAYLAAYNKDMELAKQILAKHRNVEIRHQPPSMNLQTNTCTQGWVHCVGRG